LTCVILVLTGVTGVDKCSGFDRCSIGFCRCSIILYKRSIGFDRCYVSLYRFSMGCYKLSMGLRTVQYASCIQEHHQGLPNKINTLVKSYKHILTV